MIYEGTLNTRSKKMSALAKRAQGIFNAQRQRCSNKNNNSYKTYGAKGIRVEYGPREFIGWWLAEYKKKKWHMASVGRIDHSKNYSFDNIEMVEQADNALEMYERTGGNKAVTKTPVVLFTETECHAFSSSALAAKFARVTPSLICLRKRVPFQKNHKFKYRVMDLDNFLKGV